MTSQLLWASTGRLLVIEMSLNCYPTDIRTRYLEMSVGKHYSITLVKWRRVTGVILKYHYMSHFLFSNTQKTCCNPTLRSQTLLPVRTFSLKPSYINNPYLYEDLELVNFVFFLLEGENESVASRLSACIYIFVKHQMGKILTAFIFSIFKSHLTFKWSYTDSPLPSTLCVHSTMIGLSPLLLCKPR
jgi:hypothetical protein